MAVVMVMTKLAIGLDIRVIMNFISNGYLDKEEIILLIVLQIELLLLQVIPVVAPTETILVVVQVGLIKTLLQLLSHLKVVVQAVLLGVEATLVQRCSMLRLLMNSGV